MKSLPVIQPPHLQEHPGSTRPLQTAGMVNDPERSAALMPQIVKALSNVFDPEIPVNIYDLGLVYDVIVDASNRVGIRMTLTAPACPAAQFLPRQVTRAIEAVPGVTGAAWTSSGIRRGRAIACRKRRGCSSACSRSKRDAELNLIRARRHEVRPSSRAREARRPPGRSAALVADAPSRHRSPELLSWESADRAPPNRSGEEIFHTEG